MWGNEGGGRERELGVSPDPPLILSDPTNSQALPIASTVKSRRLERRFLQSSLPSALKVEIKNRKNYTHQYVHIVEVGTIDSLIRIKPNL